MYVICRVRKPSLSGHWPESCLLSGTLLVDWKISRQVHISLQYGCFFLTYSNKNMYYVTIGLVLSLMLSFDKCLLGLIHSWTWLEKDFYRPIKGLL